MQQEKSKVVLDTNIVISAAISMRGSPAKVFELLLKKKIINYTTREIIDEIEEVIERPLIRKCIDDEYKSFIMDKFQNNSIIIKPAFSETVVKQDSKDDKFINCALSANTNIISGDKHLLQLKEYKGIKILTANEFIALINP